MKIPINKYTKIFLRTVKDLNLTHYLDITQLYKGCGRNNIDGKALNSINAVIMTLDSFLSLDTPSSIYIMIERTYHDRIRKDVINNLCEVIEKSFKGYCYNDINTETIDFRLRFNTTKDKLIKELKNYNSTLFCLSTKYFYSKIFRGCDITLDRYDTIITKIINEIKNGRIE